MDVQRKPELDSHLAEAVRSGVYQSAEDVIEGALANLRERDESSLANRQAIEAKILRAMEELESGGTAPGDKFDAYLRALKSQA
jgi:Arc/MetJ-type ribon-helix-helix transcriptional regulator